MLASYDIVIVGGGPAGLSRGHLRQARGAPVLVLEKNGFGGQIAWSPKVDNFPRHPGDLRRGARGPDVRPGPRYGRPGRARGGHRPATEGRACRHNARGRVRRKNRHPRNRSPAPQARRPARGRSSPETACATALSATAPSIKTAPVAVAGGGDAALQDALLLSNGSSKVYIIHRRDEFRAEAANVSAARSRPNIEFCMSSRVAELEGEGELTGLVIEPVSGGERRSIKVDGLFVAVGYEPRTRPLRSWRTWTRPAESAAGEDCAAGVPGIFAAGTAGPRRSASSRPPWRRRGRSSWPPAGIWTGSDFREGGDRMKVALIQMQNVQDKQRTSTRPEALIREAASGGGPLRPAGDVLLRIPQPRLCGEPGARGRAGLTMLSRGG